MPCKCLWTQATRNHRCRKCTARLSTMTHRAMKRALQHFSRGVRTEDASACGRRSAVIVGCADGQRTDFLFRGRDVAITMNSVKILHAVRSAITSIGNSWASCIFYEISQDIIISSYVCTCADGQPGDSIRLHTDGPCPTWRATIHSKHCETSQEGRLQRTSCTEVYSQVTTVQWSSDGQGLPWSPVKVIDVCDVLTADSDHTSWLLGRR